MEKLLLMSTLIMTVALPFATARDPSCRRGFKRLLWIMLIFNFIYSLAIVEIMPRFFVPTWFH